MIEKQKPGHSTDPENKQVYAEMLQPSIPPKSVNKKLQLLHWNVQNVERS